MAARDRDCSFGDPVEADDAGIQGAILGVHFLKCASKYFVLDVALFLHALPWALKL